MADATYQPKTYRKLGGDELVIASGGAINIESGGIVAGVALNGRFRSTIAEINAGKTLLPAIAGYKYRVQDVTMIAIGGNVGAVTTVDIKGTVAAGPIIIFAGAQASLTRSAIIRAGGTGGAVLADGASFVTLDVNTAITIIKAGADVTTATHVDVLLDYVIEV